MRLIAVFVPGFMTRFWTTIGQTIYVPDRQATPDMGHPAWLRRHHRILAHEHVHRRQFRKYGILVMALLYSGPFPFVGGLAWGRWFVEREAYLVSIQLGADIDWVVDTLWRSYFFTWPRPLMRRWFENKLATPRPPGTNLGGAPGDL